MSSKKCSYCKQEKEISSFWKLKSGKNKGLYNAWCKNCGGENEGMEIFRG